MIAGSLGSRFATAKALAAKGCNVMLDGFADAATIDARQSELRELGISATHPNHQGHTRLARHPGEHLTPAIERRL